MGMEMRQELKLSQQLVMTPQLQQAIRLLQQHRPGDHRRIADQEPIAEAQVQRWRSERDLYLAKIERSQLRAPMDGKLITLLLKQKVGKFQPPGEPFAVVEKADRSRRDLTESEKKEQELLRKTQFAATPTVPTQVLKGGLSIVSVSTPHQTEKYTKGSAYIYFFPSGTSEQANIVLQRGDDFYTVQVAPFAGKVRILPKKVESLDDDNDS